MNVLAGFLIVLLVLVMNAPRQTGRFIAKILIGYRAQLRDEGHTR